MLAGFLEWGSDRATRAPDAVARDVVVSPASQTQRAKCAPTSAYPAVALLLGLDLPIKTRTSSSFDQRW